MYSHLSNSRGGWNKRGGGAKVLELIDEEIGINVEGGIFWKKLLQNCNKRGVESSKKFKINKRVSTFIREMRVCECRRRIEGKKEK